MKVNRILVGDCLRQLRTLPDQCVQMCLTSPPYYGLRSYLPDGHPDKSKEIGTEKTPELYVGKMVKVFREVRRVLRDDGCLFLNIGDSYAANRSYQVPDSKHKNVGNSRASKVPSGLKAKDMIGIPWMLAFALRADGWYLRDDIIWHKKSPMTSSVEDRCCKAHEYVFLLTKKARYFWDIDAIMEPSIHAGVVKTTTAKSGSHAQAIGSGTKPHGNGKLGAQVLIGDNRFPRSVWSLSSNTFKGAHFATMPTKLAEKCIKAGTSEKGCCPECGAPWVRIVKRKRVATRPGADTKVNGTTSEVHGNRDPERHVTKRVLKGWKAGCGCGEKPVPCVVLDPFFGAGTSGVVAKCLQRTWIGCELSEKYADMAFERIAKVDAGFGLFGS